MALPIPLPPTRPLKIYAIDPQFAKREGNRDSVLVDYEPLTPGPVGDRIAVVDYDGGNDCFYEPVDLEDHAVLMQGGLDWSEADPRFHQQMVYAVAMRTLQHFDRALGRRVALYRDKSHPKLRIVPHAFNGANAYYDPEIHAVLFGYFRADPEDPGLDNLPNQIIFTCLSHDIVAHEVTHALIHRLRPHFLEATNIDILAFHEGFADLVALFQHFTHATALRAQIRAARGDLTSPDSMLSKIAVQFGQATRSGGALRSGLRSPDAVIGPDVTEPHTRGGILLAAVFDGFKTGYANEAAPLIRLATGGSGLLPPGELSWELTDQLVRVAERVAEAALTMIIRAFDYMPPMDMTFGDFLRALVTSDMTISPEDRYGLRAAMIQGFRARGIYPDGVLSLAEESLAWCPASDDLPRVELNDAALRWFHKETIHRSAETSDERHRRAHGDHGIRGEKEDYTKVQASAAMLFHKFATDHAAALGLNPDLTISVRGFHGVTRVSPEGKLLSEIVMRVEQQDKSVEGSSAMGGLPLRGGCTIIASIDGRIRYVIGKPLPGAHETGELGADRHDSIKAFVAQCDARDPRSAYQDPCSDARAMRMIERANLRGLHEDAGI